MVLVRVLAEVTTKSGHKVQIRQWQSPYSSERHKVCGVFIKWKGTKKYEVAYGEYEHLERALDGFYYTIGGKDWQ